MKTKITITLPLRDNRGRSLKKEVEHIKSTLLTLAGGISTFRVKGAWCADSGRIYRDTSDVVYSIVAPALAWDILNIYAPSWSALLRQECILVECANVEAHFVEPARTLVPAAA